MRFFKYLVFVFIITFSSSSFAYTLYRTGVNSGIPVGSGSSAAASCQAFVNNYNQYYTNLGTKQRGQYSSATETQCSFKWALNPPVTGLTQTGSQAISKKVIACPSATEVTLKIPVNAQKYQCVNQCQYALRGCVDIDFEPGMTCSAISTGIDCGGTPPTPPKDPTDNTQTPDAPGDVPAAPGQNTSNTNTNTATSTGTSTSTSTSTTTNNTTNNTSTTNTTTTTVNNTTTKIDLSSLESAIESIGKLLGGKLDAIKEALGGESGSENGTTDGTDLTETNKKLDDIKNNGDKLNNWLQGKNEDGTGGGVGDNPFGTDVTPERTLDAQSFKTNIFQSNAQCPADKTLSMTLFTGRTFSRTLSFSMWCDKLAIFGSLILIAAYLYGASIIVRNS